MKVSAPDGVKVRGTSCPCWLPLWVPPPLLFLHGTLAAAAAAAASDARGPRSQSCTIITAGASWQSHSKEPLAHSHASRRCGLGRGGGRLPTVADGPAMPYHRGCVCMAAPGLQRDCGKDPAAVVQRVEKEVAQKE